MNKKGFTITEIIVAITVFSIGVLGIAAFFASSSQTTRNSSNLSIASNIASGLVDEELSQTYDSLIVGNGAKTPVSTDTASPFNKFQKQINISLVDSNLNPSATDIGLKKIDIFVYYNEGTTERNIETATLKTDR